MSHCCCNNHRNKGGGRPLLLLLVSLVLLVIVASWCIVVTAVGSSQLAQSRRVRRGLLGDEERSESSSSVADEDPEEDDLEDDYVELNVTAGVCVWCLVRDLCSTSADLQCRCVRCRNQSGKPGHLVGGGGDDGCLFTGSREKGQSISRRKAPLLPLFGELYSNAPRGKLEISPGSSIVNV